MINEKMRSPVPDKAADPGFWEKVRTDEIYERFRSQLRSLWDANAAGGVADPLTYSDFKLFFTTGDRSVYEGRYFKRRRALASAALMSLLYPEKDEYLTVLTDTVWCVCDEYTWCLPAHQKQIERSDRSVIDLFASETGFALAEIDALLGDRLDPLIRDRIAVEIRQRIEEPFLAKEPYSWWETGTNNWTAVCTGSVACTLMLTDPETARRLIPRFERSMDRFLTGFSDEGICYEGPGYWKYGFGFFTVYADMLRRFTDGKIDRFGDPKVKKIASFLQKIFLSGKSAASFSDGGAFQDYQLGLQHFLKVEYPGDVDVFDPGYSYCCDGCARFCLFLRSALWLDEKIYEDSVGRLPGPAEYRFPEAQWMIKRTEKYGFAAKGGTNDEPHNQNDVGSFIFAKNGVHCLTDPGAGRYTRQYFDPKERYSFTECSSRGHSVPIVGGGYQKEGAAYRAEDVRFEDNAFSLDLAPAYGIPELKKLRRTFTFTDDGVRVEDEFGYSGAGRITERFVTRTEPEIFHDYVKIGDARLYRLTPGVAPAVSCDNASSGVIWFVDFVLPEGSERFCAEIR